jgi:hypothetical protein
MFAIGSQAENGLFSFVQNNSGHIYTWPDKKTAMVYFQESADRLGHLYQIEPDLSIARLIETGKGGASPQLVELTETQKTALYQSFVYKSLLAWAPRTETILV